MFLIVYGEKFCQKAAKQFLLAFAKSPILTKKKLDFLWSSHIKEKNGKRNKSNNIIEAEFKKLFGSEKRKIELQESVMEKVIVLKRK